MTKNEQALKAVEYLTCGDCLPNEELIEKIYRIAHSTNKECFKNHPEWSETAEEAIKSYE